MKLHYSQTYVPIILTLLMFYYLMKLHYSQTYTVLAYNIRSFYYLMKLHYSQTSKLKIKCTHYNVHGNFIR